MVSRILMGLGVAALLAGPAAVAQTVYVLDAEDWSRPRGADMLIELMPVREAVAELREAPSNRLAILFPPGEQGEFWAAELRDWLVALGIPSARLDVRPDESVSDQLDLMIVR